MTVRELNRDQLIELKERFLIERNDANGEGTSWGELAAADELISDEEIFEEYEPYDFGCDGFFCSCGKYDEED